MCVCSLLEHPAWLPLPFTNVTCVVLATEWVEMETNISGTVNLAKIKYSAGTDCSSMTFIFQFGFTHLSFLWEHQGQVSPVGAQGSMGSGYV